MAFKERFNTCTRSLMIWALLALLTTVPKAAEPVQPLPRAHAHNDYEHTRPLLDALDQGFCSVEADVHLVDGQLLVAHDRSQVRPERTLRTLYLTPLLNRVRANSGRVHPNGPPLTLLIDIKGNAEQTYDILKQQLQDYTEMLTVFAAGQTQTNAVTVILSGNRPRQTLLAETERYAGYDGRLNDLSGAHSPSFMPLISDNWTQHFEWRGEGPFTEADRQKLGQLVDRAHEQGYRIRFWGVPDNPRGWDALNQAGVDLINTDNLVGLRRFLTAASQVDREPAQPAKATQADYERALGLSRRWQNRLYRASITPHWLNDQHRFWYRVTTGQDRHEFILVDADDGSRSPLFEADRLADALRSAGVSEARADRLPLERLEFDPENGVAEFRADGRWWRWFVGEARLEALRDRRVKEAGPGPIPRASRGNGPETYLTFINHFDGEVEIFWLDTDGRKRSYAKLKPGQRHRQHTFAGHAWIVVDVKTARTLVGLHAEEEEELSIEVTDPGNQPQQEIETTEDTKRRTVQPGTRSSGASPDGQWETFVRASNLWLRDADSGEEFPLSTDGGPDAAYHQRVSWAPDSQHLVAWRVIEGDQRKIQLVESTPEDQLQPKLHTVDYAKPGDRLEIRQPRLFRISDRENVPVADALFPNPYDLRDLRWSPGGTHFTFVYNQRGHQVVRLLAVDAASGRVRALVNEECDTFFDYANKLYTHYLDATDEIIWMSERDGWNHLYLIDATTGTVKHQLTRGEWVVRGVDHVDPERRQIWVWVGGFRPEEDPYHVHLIRVGLDGGEPALLTEGDGTHTARFSPDRRYFIDTWSRVDQPPVIELRRALDGVLITELERADTIELVATGWQPPQRFVAKGRDGGTDVYGIIHRPINFDPQRRYPVIEQIYAGPHSAHVPKTFRAYHGAQSMAELGFIVVQIDGMGTSHRSKAFHDVCWKNLGDAGFPDRIRWIRAAAAEDRSMDLGRVGIYGGSAGGQNAMRALIAHGDFYHVAVADCGCHDNRMDKIWWNELWMSWPIGPQYEESSNVTQAHRLQGKLLLIVGELDRNVDPASTMQVVHALVKADKDFDLLVLPGTGHGAAETPYGNRRRMDYFVRHLLGVEPRSQ